ncbi:uncharacterized protein A1O9_05347 [Exophiala aquamarina CBS 119918]|uniref:Uncharacterized protein n=1 Tax=Exophiala aquamarina CBS 119918 TaxID=1182545 RepID=A0A072PPJ0_9EURO|nr:uncharacterized protein A1O9_05347 [Exophiala aquamarina CBS 119918]KEF57430.1 hypothetical protein A1O9_05347 [Exophiala aquamarina CBS 119918]
MPSLKDLVCVVQWANTRSPFPEYGTRYGDGVVETYIAIPSHPQAFTIRLTSRKFISEGLSMVVFIDGNYQCNRNRVNLRPTKKNNHSDRSEVDFIVRQKEKPMGDGAYLGREWRFDDHNIVPDLPRGVNQSHFDELGTIEVLVLRCHTHNPTESQMSASSSGEDSLIYSGDVNTFNEEENDFDPNHEYSKVNQEFEPEEGGLGAMFGLFDGPSDYPPGYYGHHVTPPSNGYHQSCDWQPPSGEYERRRPQRPLGPPYPPEQGSSHPHYYRSDPQPLNQHHQHFFIRERPPSHTYPTYGQSKPERRVHFDYGDIETQNGHHRERHDHIALHSDRPAWRGNPDYFHNRAGPGYQDPEPHPRGPHPYEDYAPPPPSSHYAYDADNRVYLPYADQSHAYGNHHQAGHHSIQPFGQQSTVGHQCPGPANFPITPVPWVAGQPQFSTQSVPVVLPPNLVPVPRPVTGMPIYSAPGAAAFFHLQPPANVSNMIPQPVPAPFAAPQIGRENAMQQTTNGRTSFSGANNNPSAGGGDFATGNNTTSNANNGAGGTHDWNINTDNVAGCDTWDRNTGNTTTDSGANWNNNTGNTATNENGDWNNNNDTQNNNSSGWDNSNDVMQNNNDSNGDGWGDTNQSNDKVQPDNWNTDQTNNTNGDWNSDRNNNANGDWNNDQTNNANDNTDNTPTPATSGKRSLYGPHGAYYTSKVFADTEAPADAEEEPRYDVPQAIAQGRGTSKQVQPGKGYLYNKKRCAPRYIDTMDEPYARFVFKYRTKEQIKNETGIEVAAEPTDNADVNALEQLDKNELIQMVIRAKGALGGEIPAPLPKDAAAKTPTPSFEQVPVEPPETAFLKYSLPPARVVSFQGLGIKNSPNDNSNSQQKNSWDNTQQASGDQNWGSSGNNNNTGGDDWNNGNSGGAPGWSDNVQQNNNAPSGVGAGWDGQQEKNTSNTNKGKRGSVDTQNQGSGTMGSSQQQQNNSRRSSAISPKNNISANNNTAAGDPELTKYLAEATRIGGPSGPNPNWATPAGPQQSRQNQTPQPQPQPSSGGIQTIGTGFVGGGGATTTSLNYHKKPPTPELKPCSPATVDNGEWPVGPPAPDQTAFGAGAGAGAGVAGFMPSAQAAAPSGGW